MGVVEYVLPNTPASDAGIKRGDVFTTINNTKMNGENYYSLVTLGGNYTLTIDSFISSSSTLAIRTIEINEIEDYHENPVYLDSIYYIEGKTIGYLMYTSFIADYDSSDVDQVFASFKAAGVTDLILDLRYNLGGDGSSMKNLGNLIAPSSNLGQIFMREVWNDLYNDYWTQTYGDEYLISRIETHENNINLTGKLIGLTTSSSASASEGLLNGLKPLTDLSLIGTQTHGKYTGMVVIPDDDTNPEWALIPIVMKTTNKKEESVRGGMVPDILIEDNALDGYQLGDIRETYLAKAIETITGTITSKSGRVVNQSNHEILGHFKGSKELTARPILIDDRRIELQK